jgi:signal transduction histidine kinase/CheY-like chemotaxis protein
MNVQGGIRLLSRILSALFASALFALALSFPARAEQPPSGPLIRVGVYDNRPIIFRDEDGEAAGFFVDILEQVARERGWRIQYVFDRWTNVFDAVRAGAIDLLPAVAYDEARSKFLAFSEQTLLTNWGQVYVRRDDSLQSLLDLRGRIIGVQRRDTHGAALLKAIDKFGIEYAVVEFDTYRQLFEALGMGIAEAVAVNRIFGTQNSGQYDVRATPVVFNPIELRFAAPLGDPRHLLPALDARVAAMMRERDSVYHRSQARWFGGVAPDVVPRWLLPGLSLVGAVLMLLAGMNMIMRRRVAERTAELVEARDAAHAASEAKSRFLANMSHEVRTPLNGLLGMLQILRDTGLDREQEEYVQTALHSGRNLLTVINDVLDLSKIEAGAMDVVEEPYSLSELVGGVCGLFVEEARRKGIGLSWETDAKNGDWLAGDPGRLRQMLFNIIGNAVKFTRSGGVHVLARVAAGQDAASERLRIVVRDTGIGIDPGLVESCFEPFCQLDASSTRAYGGAGLGLSIVRRLADLMHGEVEISSEPDQGTEFLVILPTRSVGEHERPDRDAEQRARAAQTRAEPKGLRILIGEDNRVNRLAMRRFLEKLGHSPIEAGNGREVLDLLALERVDCVLMDVQMPIMDGLEATRRIRAGEVGAANRALPIVAVTAHAMKGDREQFLAGGMDAYLAKPVDREDLRRVLGELFGVPA